jgi:phosphonopyruvate decarboxylase
MKLGTLATAGWLCPENFHHVVFDNGVHDSTGGQPTASPHVDTALVARACGYRRAATVSTRADLRSVFAEHLSSGGPTFLRVVVEPGARPDLGRPRLTPRDAYDRFRAWLSETR